MDPLYYRPVALTSVPCKLLERVIVSHLQPYLETNNILSDHQYGFRRNYSTLDQLIVTYDRITRDLDQGDMTDLVFFDYSKSFP